MADHKHDDLGRVIDELSRARAEADDDDRLSLAADDPAGPGIRTKGEQPTKHCESHSLEGGHTFDVRLHDNGGHHTPEGGREAFSPVKDPLVLGFMALALIALAVRLL